MSLSDKAPYPPSPVIKSMEWAPMATIHRLGPHSDTWPCTWADDDDLYISWADGTGFEQESRRLSMGFGKVIGDPPLHHGIDIPSPTGEDAGDGRSGKKASGILMVDGVLYVFARNDNKKGVHTRIGWSSDHAGTWTWADWAFEEFGAPTFLNFGKNYAGARDEYVYVYAHDHESAYVAADRMILARVPKARIAKREAYEFFVEVGADGQPVWATDITKRGSVFDFPERCCRSGISYNAPLKRYLWWQQLEKDGVDERFEGGFGVYDAPEPWGPWTTVYFTELWDVGPGESANFPTKWMSDDGKTVHLVFSGDDTFAVRKATLQVAAG